MNYIIINSSYLEIKIFLNLFLAIHHVKIHKQI